MQSVVDGEPDARQPLERSARSVVWVVVFAWAAIVVAAAVLGAFERIAPPVIPAVVLGANVTMLVAYRRSAVFRASVRAIETRWLLWFQATRAPIGAAFLYYGAQHTLPERWASHAGWGDLVVGLGAVALASISGDSSRARRARNVWGLVGLVDILTVVVHAQYVALVERDLRFVAVVGRLPFVVIPLFIVPLVIATHALLFVRDARTRN